MPALERLRQEDGAFETGPAEEPDSQKQTKVLFRALLVSSQACGRNTARFSQFLGIFAAEYFSTKSIYSND